MCCRSYRDEISSSFRLDLRDLKRTAGSEEEVFEDGEVWVEGESENGKTLQLPE
jgi:hypothetical protein